jgi:hypothetical protein
MIPGEEKCIISNAANTMDQSQITAFGNSMQSLVRLQSVQRLLSPQSVLPTNQSSPSALAARTESGLAIDHNELRGFQLSRCDPPSESTNSTTYIIWTKQDLQLEALNLRV